MKSNIYYLFVLLLFLGCKPSSDIDNSSNQQTTIPKGKLTIATGHNYHVSKVIHSPDGKYIVSGSNDATIKVWEATSGKLLHSLTGDDNSHESLRYSPDGRYIIYGKGQTLNIWEVATENYLHQLEGHQSAILGATCFSNGKLLMTASDTDIFIWEIETGQLIRTLEKNAQPSYFKPMLSADEKLVMYKHENVIKVREIKTGELINFLKEEQSIRGIVASTKQQQVISVCDCKYDYSTLDTSIHNIKIYNIETGNLLYSFLDCSLNEIQYSLQEKYLIARSKGIIKILNATTGELIRKIQAHPYGTKSLAFSPDGQHFASGGTDNTIKLWNIQTGKLIHAIEGLKGWALSLEFSPNGKYLIAGNSGNGNRTVQRWNVRTKQFDYTIKEHDSVINDVLFSSDGRYIAAGSRDNTIKIWDIATGQLKQTFEDNSEIRTLDFSPDNQQIVSGSRDNFVHIWNIETGEQEQSIKAYQKYKTNSIHKVTYSKDGLSVRSAGGNNTIETWDIKTGKQLSFINQYIHGLNSFAYSPDEKEVFICANDSYGQIIDTKNSERIRRLKHPRSIKSASYSPNGKYILTGSSDPIVRIWQSNSEQLHLSLEGHVEWISSVNYSNDGQYIVSGSGDKTIRVWHAETGDILNIFKGHTSWITAVNFSPDGKYVISGSYDNTIKIWEIATGELLATITSWSAEEDNAYVIITPDGKYDGNEAGLKKLYYVNKMKTIPLSDRDTSHVKGLLPKIFKDDSK